MARATPPSRVDRGRRSGVRFSQDLVHRLSLGQLIDQLVQVTDFPHRRLLDILDPDAAYDAFDQGSQGIDERRLRKEGFKVRLLFQLSFQLLLTIACQSGDDLVDLSLRPSLLLRLRNVQRVHPCEAHRIDSVLFHE
jgi:hypothetical protein